MYISWLTTMLSSPTHYRGLRHEHRLHGLQNLISRRATIEVCMLASIMNIENAFDFANKALSFALAHRIQVSRPDNRTASYKSPGKIRADSRPGPTVKTRHSRTNHSFVPSKCQGRLNQAKRAYRS